MFIKVNKFTYEPLHNLSCYVLLLLNGYNGFNGISFVYEPPRGKTNNVVSDQVRHKQNCTNTEKS